MIVVAFLNLGLSLAFSLLAGWGLMLAVGVVHHEWIPACPALGYWPAFLLTVLLRWAFMPLPSSTSDS